MKIQGIGNREQGIGREPGRIIGVIFAATLMFVCVAAFAATPSLVSDTQLAAAGVGKTEVSLGDLVADAIRDAMKADFAFVSASELKEKQPAIAKGKVSASDITPFVAYADDPIVTVQMTGRQVKLALERSILIYPQSNLGFLQVSGLRFTADSKHAPEGRVLSIYLDDTDKTVAPSDAYTVAMTSSMANGALGYWKIWTKSDIKEPKTQVTIPQAIESFLAGKTKINYSGAGRITISGS
jgi:2',3'-cyclic-nucleotide 2'-phosphodiesterase (5'-nucleotidase family)